MMYKVIREDGRSMWSAATPHPCGVAYVPGEWTVAPAGTGLFAFRAEQDAAEWLRYLQSFRGAPYYSLWAAEASGVLPTPWLLPHLSDYVRSARRTIMREAWWRHIAGEPQVWRFAAVTCEGTAAARKLRLVRRIDGGPSWRW